MAKHRDVLPHEEIVSRLFKFGYFGVRKLSEVKAISGKGLRRAVRNYQEFVGLKPDGTVGEITAAVLKRRRCGLPDMELRADDTVCCWPMQRITYHTALKLPGISLVESKQAFDEACARWQRTCRIELIRVTNAKTANIVAKSGRGRANGLDTRGGTLGWSDLPCDVGPRTRINQMFDEAEDWTYAMAAAVICHELGHALGLPHLPKGNLMAPYYDAAVTLPQRGDILEMGQRYR